MKQDTPTWRKSTHSADNGGDCIELADLAPGVGVRDSKDPEGPHLTMTRRNLAALTQIVKNI
ncbi:DUF397 domain-containing protein [Actinomadura harenae]|uniref:DUF397 domain-containing protein n=1 Tax=Actinomadura harenae TaxID=2483351 RepID=A0A3M2LZF9_9ACTN|nr:DUF397 domain-containing protein [Actinomadura harenae]RMI42310.1 DUF397 domain-containing protein [Actinomadura harenae]